MSAPVIKGKGIGRALLRALIDAATAAGVWTLQTGIFPENKASLALHEGCGFRVVGRRERLGQLNGVWRDVLLLERRSNLVGAAPITPVDPPTGPVQAPELTATYPWDASTIATAKPS